MKINKMTRIGILILIIGFAFNISAIIRSDYQVMGEYHIGPIPPNETFFIELFLPPRDIRLEVDGNDTMNLYLFDKFGYMLYNNCKIFKPIFYIKFEKRGIYFISLPKRDQYYIVIENVVNNTIVLSLTIFMFGFEKDILQSSIFSILFGAIFIFLNKIQRFCRKLCTSIPYTASNNNYTPMELHITPSRK
ncbi:MAG: hypothetical protein ACP6IU_11505 [Candidatus Asgardarchaeia archaeon]